MPVTKPANKPVPHSVMISVVTKVTSEMGLTQLARSVIIYVIGVTCNYGNMSTARALQIPHSTVSHHCRLVEDKRDDPAFDKQLTALEKQFDGSA